ncbi:Calcium-binding mitochondrial carrier protein SCaMC-2 [Orchesella cincta]|uniref:Calcium-binding mitochondrial carrier protein SCaMC-2 n=1 Tax=Orchesella cincta TaxID=48709 RepID=A0A1D2MM36_ORCCI|nr:Calcium-binding mitochondrial carrier protein SCaMC-2 [Orchesella cincta]
MPEDDTVRLERLFNKLDHDGDGRINVTDLAIALKKRGVDKPESQATLILTDSDTDLSGDITLEEFINYARRHEKKLKLIFTNIDRNHDGKLDLNEILVVCKEQLGIEFKNETEVREMIKRIAEGEEDTVGSAASVNPHPKSSPKKRGMLSKRTLVEGSTSKAATSTVKNSLAMDYTARPDGTLEISWEDWRDYLILSPHVDSLTDVLRYWRHATYLDIGEDTAVPDDFTVQEMQTGMWWRHLVAGGFAGAVSRTSTAPLDRIKVFLQVHGKSMGGLRSCLKSMIQEGGVLSLWRGNFVNVLKIAPESALKFMAYEQGKRFLKGNSNRELRIEERFLAGSLAGAFSQTLIYPLEVVKTRLALRKTGEFKGIFDLTYKMYSKEGFKVFYRGYLPNLLGILPYAGIDLAIYETLKKYYLSRNNSDTNEQPGVLVLLACGTMSSACGQIASYPLALVRTRLQASSTFENYSMSGLFKSIVQNEGLVGLYRGLMPNFMKVAPAVSISYVVYERVRNMLGVEMT